MDIDEALNVEELRERCLKHSRRAYRLLPPFEQPRILDIGCGQGQQTIELARLGGGEVVGIDIDQAALSRLRQRIDQAGLGDRVKAIHVSLFDNGFDDNSFDVLWEEGVLNLLDSSRSLPECRRC
jgi:ubiquinone/menaquinone biosynthesis C-methylase UbiE